MVDYETESESGCNEILDQGKVSWVFVLFLLPSQRVK